ncbi:uncharacterized protein LOC18030901 [Eutrema salsugineum]|uniref:uncharacterized protein LOC18030901 n=1 Tax=Eutrema salsugineum TaxID=72664 RepID=UPI000CECF701|nr:uncharacterized protein LOC18030901 [Eutrema salsugineum]
MSLGIKVFILFLLVQSSMAKYWVDKNPFAKIKPFKPDQSEIDYLSIFRGMIRGWQREADKQYPLWTPTNYMNRAIFLQKKVRGYVRLWGAWKNHRGYPYGDLRNKLQDDLWPISYSNYCRQSEGKNLLTSLVYGLSTEAGMQD